MWKLSVLGLLCLCCLPALSEPVPQLKERGGYESYLEISRDGRFVAVDHSSTVPIWDVTTRRVIHTMKGFERLTEVKFSPDGKSIVVADYPRWIGFYDLENGFKKRWTFKAPWVGEGGPQFAGSYGLQFTPDGKFLLAVDSSHGAQMGDDVVRLLSTEDGKVLHSFPKWGGRKYGGRTRNIVIVNNQTFVRSTGSQLQLYSISTGKMLKEISVGEDVYGVRATDSGILCSQQDQQSLYSKTDLVLLKKFREGEALEEHPDGALSWKRDAEGLSVTNGAQTVFRGSVDDTVTSWISGGGFLVRGKQGEGTELYDVQGKKLKSSDTYGRPSAYAPVANSITGYGGPCDIFDLTRGTKFVSLSFASSAKVSEDGSSMAILMKSGVLMVDVLATLKMGKLVLK